MAYGKTSTLARVRYGEGMTPQKNPIPDPIQVDGPAVLMSLSCNKCRRVRFARSPESAVTIGLEHAQECGTTGITIAELVTGTLDG